MSYPQKIPAYFRYLSARLQPFMRPAFWVSAGGMLLMLLLAWEYWSVKTRGNNQLAEAEQPKLDASSVKELAAFGADIDSSEVLSKELNRTSSSSPSASPNQLPSSSRAEDLLRDLPPPVSFMPDSSSPIASLEPRQRSNFGTPFSTSSTLDIFNRGAFSSNSSPTTRPANGNNLSSPTAGTTPSAASKPAAAPSVNRSAIGTKPLPAAPTRSTTTTSSPAAVNRNSRPTERGIPALPSPSAPDLIPPPILPEFTGYNTSGQATDPSITPSGVTNSGTSGQTTGTSGQTTNSPTTPPSATGSGINPSTSPISPDSLFAPESSLPSVPSTAPTIPNTTEQSAIQSPRQTSGVIAPNTTSIPNSTQGVGIQPSQLSQPNFSAPR